MTKSFDERRDALERALRHLGQPVTETEIQAFIQNKSTEDAQSDAPVTRRRFLSGVGMAAATAAVATSSARRAEAKAPAGAFEYPMHADSTKAPGRITGQDGGYGSRSQFESEVRYWQPTRTTSFTPLHKGHGIITPSGLHYERHHAGIPNIDPAKHSLIIHGLVNRPMKFSVADLMRFPSVSRIYFMECSGTSGTELMKVTMPSAQRTHGLVSTSEWTGVPLSTLFKEVGLRDDAAWVLAEGADAAVMTRSVPIDKCLSDALIVYAQNGEAIRPEQGYPIRLLLPGWEGNISIKWLRRLEVAERPYQTREETSKYSDLITKTGKARQFTFTMEAKSVITFPSGEARLPGPGFYEITGLAWSGRGKIARVEVTADQGKTWHLASLQDPILPIAQTRFRFPWVWDGAPAIIASRATDETGYTQPTKEQLIAERGPFEVGLFYHMNGIQHWSIDADGTVKNWHPLSRA